MLHTIDNYLDLVREASSCLGVKVFLAGGAVRDVLLDRVSEIQDLDLWIISPDIEETRERSVESGFFGTRFRSVGHKGANLGRDGDILAIDYFVKDGQELNLIYLKREADLPDILKGFDFGVNQAGICPEKGLIKTEAFDLALSRRLLQVTRKDSPKRARERLSRMRSKFPDWQVEDTLPAPPPRPKRSSFNLGY